MQDRVRTTELVFEVNRHDAGAARLRLAAPTFDASLLPPAPSRQGTQSPPASPQLPPHRLLSCAGAASPARAPPRQSLSRSGDTFARATSGHAALNRRCRRRRRWAGGASRSWRQRTAAQCAARCRLHTLEVSVNCDLSDQSSPMPDSCTPGHMDARMDSLQRGCATALQRVRHAERKYSSYGTTHLPPRGHGTRRALAVTPSLAPGAVDPLAAASLCQPLTAQL